MVGAAHSFYDVTIKKWQKEEKFINASPVYSIMPKKPLIRDIDAGKLKKWLTKNTRISVQNPWFVANEKENVEVLVKGVCQTPVEVITLTREASEYPYLIRPDTVPNVSKAMKALKTDPLHMGIYFCPPDAVPQEFRNHDLKLYRQAVQYGGDFDATLYGPNHRHLRQNLARGEKHGLQFERTQYHATEVSDLVIQWTVAKHFGVGDLEGTMRAFKSTNCIANVAFNPFGVLYGVRGADGTLRAIAATLEMGDYVSVECIASYRDVDRAQEFLETRMWQEFSRKGVRVVDRGNMDKQTPSLRAYKEKFAPMHIREWVYADPVIVRTPPYKEF